MLPQNPDNQTERSQLDDQEWAQQACKELVAGCTLNIKLVKAGLWPKLLCDMETVGDLASYAAFIQGLGSSYLSAKQAADSDGH